jgi:hypothetical protein
VLTYISTNVYIYLFSFIPPVFGGLNNQRGWLDVANKFPGSIS